MSVFDDIRNTKEWEWQSRSKALEALNQLTVADVEAGIEANKKNKQFVKNLLELAQYNHYAPASLRGVDDVTAEQLYKYADKKECSQVQGLLKLDNLEYKYIEAIAELYVNRSTEQNRWWGVPGLVVNHKNFSKILEDKFVASPKIYKDFYDSLALTSKDEKNIVKMFKHIENSPWTQRKVIKRGVLGASSIAKIAKTNPVTVCWHSRKATPELLDSLAQNKKSRIHVVANKNIRPETLQALVEEADPDTDWELLQNVAYNKKASVEVLATAFGKLRPSFYQAKEFLKRQDFLTHLQELCKKDKP